MYSEDQQNFINRDFYTFSIKYIFVVYCYMLTGLHVDETFDEPVRSD